MAKRKYEFRPDKTQAGLLNKLYMTPQQRLGVLRWVLYAVMLVAISVIQDVVLCKVSVFGATTDLVPCAIILICVEMGAEKSAIFSLIAALLYKFSGTSPGYYVIGLIPVLGLLAAVARSSIFRKTLSSTMLCACIAVVLYETGVFAFGLLFQNTSFFRGIRFAVTAILSLLSYPILYPLTTAIENIGEKTWKN